MSRHIIKIIGIFIMTSAVLANPLVIEKLFSRDGHISSLEIISVIVIFETFIFFFGLYLALKANVVCVFLLKAQKNDFFLLTGAFLFVFIVGDVVANVLLPDFYAPTRYGWTQKSHKTYTRSIQDHPGHFRTARSSFFEHGFRRWGDPTKPGLKALILGDSFTEMIQVSNGEEWYSYLENTFPNVEFFVYGRGGYGSLQEFLVLDDYIDEIAPDFVLWQFCGNDLPNNLYTFDRRTYPYNNFGARPYLENGQVVYRLPLPFPELRKYSKFADLLLALYDVRMKELATAKSQKAVKVRSRHDDGDQLDPEREKVREQAYEVTSHILKMARRRAGEIPFFMFSTDRMTEKEHFLCHAAEITCIPGVLNLIEREEAKGLILRVVDDGHWNLAGNKLVGEYLVKFFKTHQLERKLLDLKTL